MKLIGIDPGTLFTGVSVFEVSDATTITLLFADTLDGKHLAKGYKDIDYLYGNKCARIYAMGKHLDHLSTIYGVDAIVSEAAFYNPRRPGAYAPLVEVISLFRSIAIDRRLPFTTIDPSTIKRSVGVKGNSGDKSLMLTAITKLNINNSTDINYLALSEHAVDAIAIGYSGCVNVIEKDF